MKMLFKKRLLIFFLINFNCYLKPMQMPETLFKQAARCVIKNNIDFSNIIEDIKPYLFKLDKIEKAGLPERLKILFLNSIDKNQNVLFSALKLISKLEEHFNKEEISFIKDTLCSIDPYFFKIDPFMSVLLSLNNAIQICDSSSNLITKFFNSKYKNMLNFLKKTIKEDPDFIRPKFELARIYLFIEQNANEFIRIVCSFKNKENIFYIYLYLHLINVNFSFQYSIDSIYFNIGLTNFINTFKKSLTSSNRTILTETINILFTKLEYKDYFKHELRIALKTYNKKLNKKNNRFKFIYDYFILFQLYVLLDKKEEAAETINIMLDKKSKENTHYAIIFPALEIFQNNFSDYRFNNLIQVKKNEFEEFKRSMAYKLE